MEKNFMKILFENLLLGKLETGEEGYCCINGISKKYTEELIIGIGHEVTQQNRRKKKI
jgi:hypothetical protein